jgi:hypothetical protein
MAMMHGERLLPEPVSGYMFQVAGKQLHQKASASTPLQTQNLNL